MSTRENPFGDGRAAERILAFLEANHLRQVEDMGYRIAILPGLLLMHIIGSCRQILKDARESRTHPVPLGDISIPEMWRVVGADAWDAVQARYK